MEFRKLIELESDPTTIKKRVRYKITTEDDGLTIPIGPLTSDSIPANGLRREITGFGIGEYEFNFSKYPVMHVELRISSPCDYGDKKEECKMPDAELCLLASGRIY